MLVWFEALTAKQALLFGLAAQELEKAGIRCLVTTRRYDYAVGILKLLNVEYRSIGEYGGSSLRDKLVASLRRQLELVKVLSSLPECPSVHVSFTSPDSTRVAYGLGIPVISLTDSPHSLHVNRLAIPLSSVVIAPVFASGELQRFLVDASLVTFDGVFERAWMERKVDGVGSMLNALNLEPYRYAIVRLEEAKASYYPDIGGVTRMKPIIDELLAVVDKLIVYPRYDDQRDFIRSVYRGDDRIVIPDKAYVMQELERYASVVVTGGSTMANESSLLGTPSISVFPYEIAVFRYLRERGFPLYHVPDVQKAAMLARKIAENPLSYRVDTTPLLERLEDPIPVLCRVVASYCGGDKVY